MKSLGDCLSDDLRFEVAAFDVEVNLLDPPRYRREFHRGVPISWKPERIEREIAGVVRMVQAANEPGSIVRVVLHLWGERRVYVLVHPPDPRVAAAAASRFPPEAEPS